MKTIRYEHPFFNLGAVGAQTGIARDSTKTPAERTETYFAGAWQQYTVFMKTDSFPAVNLCQLLLERDPWPLERPSKHCLL